MGSYNKWVISPLRWVVSIVTLLTTPLITTHEPPRKPLNPRPLNTSAETGRALLESSPLAVPRPRGLFRATSARVSVQGLGLRA